MKTIKVIDLLNIALYNEESLPNKIKYEGIEYKYCAGTYREKCNGTELWTNYKLLFILNDELEIIEDILDDKEKEYLSYVIRPFRDKIETISKGCLWGDKKYESEYIYFQLIEEDFSLPSFETGTMYKGMELDKGYTLEELGL